MTNKEVEAIIRKTGIIAIIRGNYGIETLLKIADALAQGGVKVMEVTLNSAGALAGITALRKALADDVLIGAGTVRTVPQIQAAIDAGAQFLISPNLDLPSVALSQKQGVLHLPGVFTASEVQMAFAAGCQMVKLFPAHMLGPAYIKALLAPLNDIAFVPTGGINKNNVHAYIEAGAVALGVGSALVQGPDQDLADLRERAMLMRRAVDDARGGVGR